MTGFYFQHCFVLSFFPPRFQYTCVQAAYTLYDKMSAQYVYIVGKCPFVHLQKSWFPSLSSFFLPFLSSFRLADHFGGKLHMGFIKIRDRLKELQVL